MSQPANRTDTPPTATRERRHLIAWRNAVFAIFFISGLSFAAWVARVPAVRDSLTLSTAEVGVLIFGLSAGSVLGLTVAAWLLQTLGARRAMVLSFIIAAVGLAVVGAGSDLFQAAPLVFAGLALVGFGLGSVDVMMNVEGAAAERAIKRTLMPLMHACFSLGTVVGALLGAGASALNISVALNLVIIAALILATAVVSVRYIPVNAELADQATKDSATAKEPWKTRMRRNIAVWRDMQLLLIGVIVLGMTFAEGSANDWLALAAVDGHGLDNTLGAVVFGVFVAAMTAGRVLGGPVLDRFGRVPVLRVSAVVGILGLLLFILAPATWLVFVGAVLWGLGASLGFPVGMSAAADDEKNSAARVSVVAIIGYAAFLIGPPVLGLIGDAIGILNALFVIVALMILAGFAAPAARERTHS